MSSKRRGPDTAAPGEGRHGPGERVKQSRCAHFANAIRAIFLFTSSFAVPLCLLRGLHQVRARLSSGAMDGHCLFMLCVVQSCASWQTVVEVADLQCCKFVAQAMDFANGMLIFRTNKI